jgi:4-amino-4-deoxy-L-arabinose transferase-like glycosyltransferase
MASPDPTPEPNDRRPRRPLLLAVLMAAAFFAAVAPTLRWQEFSGGSENLVVETVLEMRRGGPWLIPTLLDVPRVTKPPLTAWLTAAAVRQDTVARVTSRDRATRDAAFRELAWQVRWPSLLASCAMLLATYALARNLGLGPTVALASMAVCGSTLLLLRFARAATTDVQLALWVTVANAFIALAVIRGRTWAGCVGAGVALGLAFMSKGPVAFLQTLLPVALFVVWRLTSGTGFQPVPATTGDPPPVRNGYLLPVLAGTAVMLLIGLPWYGLVLYQHPGILRSWWAEVTREGATQLPRDPWYTYFVFLPWLAPWLAWFVAGAWVGALQLADLAPGTHGPVERAWRQGTVAALLLVAAPLVAMSLFKDKNERYTLPMLAPAAVLAARAAVGWWQTPPAERARDLAGHVVEAIHWLALIVIAIAAPLYIPTLQKVDWTDPLLRLDFGLAFAVAGVAILVAGIQLRRRGGPAGVAAAVAAPAAVMLLLQFPAMRMYGRMAVSDFKPVADAILTEYPDAAVYQYEPGGRTRVRIDLPIYLGRPTRAVGRDELPQAATTRPQVVVFLDRHAAQTPPLPPPWKELASGAGRNGGWKAYVLPAANGK